MNQFRVWLPPDGDHRLLRLQDAVAEVLGSQGAALPPYLPLGRVPLGRLLLEDWVRLPELGLAVRDEEGPLGALRFGLPWVDEGLPAVPSWSWVKGRLVDLVIEGESPVVWTWKNPAGWRALPK